MASRFFQLLADAAEKVTGVLELAEVMDAASSAQVQAANHKHQASETASCLKQQAVQITEPLRASRAWKRVYEACALMIGYITSTATSAGKHYKRLRSQGLMACVLEALQFVTEFAKVALSFTSSIVTGTCSKALTSATGIVNSICETAWNAKAAAVERASAAAKLAKAKTAELNSAAQVVMKDGKVQATIAGAVGGATTIGASGGVTGLAAGFAMGAAVGLVPALFTFGLSVPIGAAIGAGAGLVVGTLLGTATGAAAGGAAGFSAYSKRDLISQGTQTTLAKVHSGVDLVKDTALASAGYILRLSARAAVCLFVCLFALCVFLSLRGQGLSSGSFLNICFKIGLSCLCVVGLRRGLESGYMKGKVSKVRARLSKSSTGETETSE
ncbi:unnamed protein product [Polarella glacialis]|uniref:Uncharacterized protein n=1 Tax=Polarella glacialis TaxID=89957 RepID=A0A813EK12_POLGL|nr:unnamed protein product [Polarella glacialis]